MVYIQDSTQSFTISLTALLEGAGIISYITVHNLTTMASPGEWDGTSWIMPIPNVTEGDSMEIDVVATNNGDVADDLFIEFSSVQVTPTQALIQEAVSIPVGIELYGTWTFTMPPNDVNITINAGHVE